MPHKLKEIHVRSFLTRSNVLCGPKVRPPPGLTRAHAHPHYLCFVPGGASVLQAAALLRPADGSPLLPQLRARRGGGRSHQRFRGVPEGREPPPQRQPAGVTATQPTAGTVSQTESDGHCSGDWLEPGCGFVFEEISHKDEISSSRSSDPDVHLLLLVLQSPAGRRVKSQNLTCSCVIVVL